MFDFVVFFGELKENWKRRQAVRWFLSTYPQVTFFAGHHIYSNSSTLFTVHKWLFDHFLFVVVVVVCHTGIGAIVSFALYAKHVTKEGIVESQKLEKTIYSGGGRNVNTSQRVFTYSTPDSAITTNNDHDQHTKN